MKKRSGLKIPEEPLIVHNSQENRFFMESKNLSRRGWLAQAAFLEFCQQFFLLGSEIGGSFDDGSYMQITAFRLRIWDTPISKTEDLWDWVPAGIFKRALPSRVGTSISLPRAAR